MNRRRDPDRIADKPAGAVELQERLIAFVRAFGLLQPDVTPCGQPLSVSEAHALLELSHDAGLFQVALGERLRLQKSTVSRLVTQLEGKGWVERKRDQTDGRVIQLHLTESGRRIAGRVAKARADHYASILQRIPADERGHVLHALEVLVQAVPVSRRGSANGDRGRR